MLELEREDSGIDSDSAQRENLRRSSSIPEFMQLSEASVSEDELSTPNHGLSFWRKGINIQLDDEHFPRVNGRCSTPWSPTDRDREDSGDRSSPPLYEVELTASDEDDDGSVLELVIPIQSRRYNRVNSTSTTAKILYAILCCFHK